MNDLAHDIANDAAWGLENADDVEVECPECGTTHFVNQWMLSDKTGEYKEEFKKCDEHRYSGPIR